ncbi:MAG TPA: hypothetical protein VJH34_02395 [archaeon]|nr:hypothetical protein [archaeon]
MAMELEARIMKQIGLGQHYNWYAGGSCREVRLNAVERLPRILRINHDIGLSVDIPYKPLIDILSRISVESDSDYTLQNTWEAASYVIAAHIHNANYSNEQKTKAYEDLRKHLEKIYLDNSSTIS